MLEQSPPPCLLHGDDPVKQECSVLYPVDTIASGTRRRGLAYIAPMNVFNEMLHCDPATKQYLLGSVTREWFTLPKHNEKCGSNSIKSIGQVDISAKSIYPEALYVVLFLFTSMR